MNKTHVKITYNFYLVNESLSLTLLSRLLDYEGLLFTIGCHYDVAVAVDVGSLLAVGAGGEDDLLRLSVVPALLASHLELDVLSGRLPFGLFSLMVVRHNHFRRRFFASFAALVKQQKYCS